MLEDRRMRAGILSVTPDSATAGTDDLLVSLTVFPQYTDVRELDDEDDRLDLLAYNAKRDDTV